MPTQAGTAPRAALIGVTGYGSIYLQLVRDALAKGKIRLSAAVIINAAEVPAIVEELKGAGARIYANADEFFKNEAGKVDLCLIPVAIQWHARFTCSALRAGMNVLVEKPLAGSLEDIAEIRRAEKESGRWVAVGFQDLYTNESKWAKDQLVQGAIGTIESVRMIGLWPRSRAYFQRNGWAGRLNADGAAVLDSPMNNAFAHFVNLSLYFASRTPGESAQVRLTGADLRRAHDIESFDTATVEGVTEAGTRIWFGVSHASGSTREPEIYLRGSAGSLEWWHEKRCVITDSSGHRQVLRLPTTEEARNLMFESVVRRVLEESTFVCTTSIAERHTALVESIHRFSRVLPFAPGDITWVKDAAGRSELPVVEGLAQRLDAALRSADDTPAHSETALSSA